MKKSTPMNDDLLHRALKNYHDFLERVDALVRHIEEKYPESIACKKGCDTCCRFLTLFPVEAFALSSAFKQLPEEIRDVIAGQLEKTPDACPLLADKACLLYDQRPVICRTHGYPIYMEKDGTPLVDFCPKNFKGVTSFPKDALIGIEQLNTLLAAINNHFLECLETESPFPDRIPVSTALFLLDE